MPKKAFITGINGQDGSYLTELLLDKGYAVHGIVRREAIEDPSHRLSNIAHLVDRIQLYPVSIDNHLSTYKLISQIIPDECYHLAASSFVSYSFDDEESVLSANFNSTHFLLASIKEAAPQCRFYFAGSSEMFGDASQSPQDESTPFNPRSIYGISKVASHHLVTNYRNRYGIFACTGILYNHESPRRGHQFVTRKITSTVAQIHLGRADHLELGNLDAERDWGYAPDYVQAMWKMLQQSESDSYVIATGCSHSVRNFLEMAFGVVGLDYTKYVRTNPAYFRPTEDIPLVGDARKAQSQLDWKPEKQFEAIIVEMVESEIQALKT
ncbi:MAG: GDP-mannose 4,6-dehydratase [Nitrospinaceae bacterium]